MKPKVHFKIFKATFQSWETMCSEAAEFASTIPREDLINISQSADNSSGTIVVWYWSNRSAS